MNKFKKTGELNVIKNYINRGDIVFDVGANIGLWTREVLKNQSICMAYLFEPVPETFEILKQNFDIVKKVVIKNYGINNEDAGDMKEFYITGTKQLYVYENKNKSLSTFYRRSIEVEKRFGLQNDTTITVPTTTIDNYCRGNDIEHINFLKIDTEGSEFDVLKGASDLLALRKIDYVQFEYGACFLDAGITLKEVFEFLHDKEYTIAKITPKGLQDIDKFHLDLEDYKLTNFLAKRKGL